MPFTLHFYKSYLPSHPAAREAALNASVQAVNRLRKEINGKYGIKKWAVVL